jgi:hypothetical protein
MRDAVKGWLFPTSDISGWAFCGRALLVVLQLIAAYCFANQVSPFFYQRF